jgi:hypothetical protein
MRMLMRFSQGRYLPDLRLAVSKSLRCVACDAAGLT